MKTFRIIALILISILAVPIYAFASSEIEPIASVEAAVKKADYKLNKMNGSTRFRITSEFTNKSEIGIMEIRYKLSFYNQKGELIKTVSGVYNGQDTSIAPGKNARHYLSGQLQSEEKPDKAVIEILGIKTVLEMPPVYLPKPGDLIYNALSNANLEKIKEEPPVKINLWIDRGGARWEAEVTDRETIAEIVEAFTQIRVAWESTTWVTDNYNGFSMEFANGESIWISLNLYNLEYNVYGNWHIYELENFAPFWSLMQTLTHPAETGTVYGGS